MSAWWFLAALGVVGYAWTAEFRLRRAQTVARATIFDTCQALFDAPQLAPGTHAYPVLRGTHRGLPIKLEVVVDTLAVRKLPVLWLKVDVLQALPIAGTLDYLVRPLNHEFWSPNVALAHELRLPAQWPQYARLGTDQPAMRALLPQLDPFIAAFSDERIKELLVTPKGVRVVYLAGQGGRAHYGVLRRAHFAALPLPADLVATPLKLACDVHQALAGAA